MISNKRHLFKIPQDVAYLNCAYMSPLLRAAEIAGTEGVARKLSPWELSRADFFSQVEQARALFAELIGAEPGDVALVPSASYGAAVACANVTLCRGQKVLVLDAEHASNLFVWMARCRECGAEIVTVPRVEASTWTEEILKRIDSSIAVIAVPNCHWFDGAFVDLEAVARAADEVGAALVVDGTQSIGALPFDVRRIRPAFAICAAYKWLLGPYGLAFLYVEPGRQTGTPLEHHVYNRVGADRVASSTTYVEAFMDGARRYDRGERSDFILLPIAIVGLRQILSWGVRDIAEGIEPLVRQVEELALDAGIEVTSTGADRPHMTGIRFPCGVPEILEGRLAEANVHISIRRDILRISPHIYNTSKDIDRLCTVLGSVASSVAGKGIRK